VSTDRAIKNLQELIRIPTISRLDVAETDWEPFDDFLAALSRLYPVAHSTLEREIVAERSLLLRWRGRSAESPSVLMAHFDVVAATDEGWEHPPFAADLTGDGEEQLIWGRGTLDDKGAVAAILEAVEAQLTAGRTPFNDLYISLGHDEETHGTGAKAISQLLAARGIRPALVLDEGGAIVTGAFPGVRGPIAAIGVSEKGTAIVRVVVEQSGGHASTPPRMTATIRLARAIVRVNTHPFPARFNEATMEMFAVLGRHARGIFGPLFRGARFTRPLLLAAFERISDETRAVTQTTAAVTMLSAGLAANALPERATATVNLRVAVDSTVADSVEHVRRAIRDDLVTIDVLASSEPAPISPAHGAMWDLLARTVERTHPGTVVAPYVQNGASDSRHFVSLSDRVYRFTPFEMTKAQRDTLHAVNERMHVATYLRGIEFYSALIAAL
jgi:carboxypeptidase PM20D1